MRPSTPSSTRWQEGQLGQAQECGSLPAVLELAGDVRHRLGLENGLALDVLLRLSPQGPGRSRQAFLVRRISTLFSDGQRAWEPLSQALAQAAAVNHVSAGKPPEGRGLDIGQLDDPLEGRTQGGSGSLRRMTDEKLARPRPWLVTPEGPSGPLAQYVAGNTYEHYAEHLATIILLAEGG